MPLLSARGVTLLRAGLAAHVPSLWSSLAGELRRNSGSHLLWCQIQKGDFSSDLTLNLTSVSLSECFLMSDPFLTSFKANTPWRRQKFTLIRGKPLSGIQGLTTPAQQKPGELRFLIARSLVEPRLPPRGLARGSRHPQSGFVSGPGLIPSTPERSRTSVVIVTSVRNPPELRPGQREHLGWCDVSVENVLMAPSRCSAEPWASSPEGLSKVIAWALRKKIDSFFVCLQPWGVSEKSWGEGRRAV